jgi:nicotinamidase-related amidase
MASSASAAAAAAVVAAKTMVKNKNVVVGKLHPSQTVLLLCDVQERFRPLIYKMETVVNTCQYMTSICQVLNVPILVTQQYTKVFGPTIAECFAGGTTIPPSSVPVVEKKKFSMLTDEVRGILAMDNKGDESSPTTSCASTTTAAAATAAAFGNRPTYIVVGIEAHVCVQQTCLDLLEQDKYQVHIICDAVSSQQASDRIVALRRLERAGCFLTTAQSAAFMLLQSANHECFKQVSKLTVEHMKKVNEFNVPQATSLDII